VNERSKRFIIGLAAGSVALALSFFLRIFAGGLFIPELAAQTLFSLIPGAVESQAVGTLGSLAKYFAFTGAVVANLFLYGVLGVLLYGTYSRLARKGYVVNVLQLSFISYSVLLVLAAILLETTEVITQPLPIQLVFLHLLPPHIAFGFILHYFFQRPIAKSELIQQTSLPQERSIDLERRKFFRIAVTGIIASAFLFSGINILSSKPVEPSGRRVSETQSTESPSSVESKLIEPELASFFASELTLNDRFYQVDINIVTPVVDANTWRLKVNGLVNNPLELTYEELKSMPAGEEYATLECVSNKIGEDLISTALWKGIPLKSILEKAQVKPEATYIVFRCYDGYDVGISLERGLQTILAYEMNGIPLPPRHGFPVRAIVPGLYGMMNAKWITEIELVNKVHEGFWQRKGWSNNAEYQIHSTIILPRGALRSRFGDLGSSRVMLGSKVPIAGIAFAGDKGISKVEVSTDGGNSWQTARIKEPLSKNAWVLWSYEWNPPAEGRYSVIVRATDGTGKVQTQQLRKPFPSGSTGYHTVDITVEA